MTHWDAGGNFRAFYYFYLKNGKTLNLGIVTASSWVCKSVHCVICRTLGVLKEEKGVLQ